MIEKQKKQFVDILLNQPLRGKQVGSVLRIEVKTVKTGKGEEKIVPVDNFWKKRLNDSKRDKCITILSDKKEEEEKVKPKKRKNDAEETENREVKI
jgi:hypothetical protein